nr:MAG TPA: hypothetical protein [Caudoviricetes sp.]DAV90228.1 MAG TPA: hypothetical protein [Caudoviricetes sp.]
MIIGRGRAKNIPSSFFSVCGLRLKRLFFSQT